MTKPQRIKDLPTGRKDRRGGGTSMVQPNGSAIGNPPHEKTQSVIDKVRLLRSIGTPLDEIAFSVDLSTDTLQRHYSRELRSAETEANAQVGVSTFNAAVGEKAKCIECAGVGTLGGKACKPCFASGYIWRREPSVTAQIWWSKNRMGWSDAEKVQVNHTHASAGDVEHISAGDMIRARLQAIRDRSKELEGPK